MARAKPAKSDTAEPGSQPATRKTLIAPSLLAADFAHLGAAAEAAVSGGADWLHLDVMDGHFVPNISFGPALVRALRPLSGLPFDVHLMIAPAEPFLAAFRDAGANHLIVHAEAGPHLHRSLQAIRDLGCVPGVAINPATPAGAVADVLDLADIALVMTVNPGFGGQAFLPSMLAKVAQVRAMADAAGRADMRVSVDGGVAPDNAAACRAAGADVLVAGSSVFGQKNAAAAIAKLRAA